MTIDIVILNYNTRELLEQLLPIVVQNSQMEGVNIVVADNASTDGSAAWMKKHQPEIELIELEQNHGFAGGYNLALQDRTADYFILLNSDAEPAPNWLNPLLEFAKSHPEMGAAQPKLLDYYKREKFEYAGAAGGYLDHFGYPFCRGRIFGNVENNLGQYNETKEVFWATGAAFFVSRAAWEKAEGLDDRFFAHMEEIDLCWRLQLLGYKNYSIPQSIVYHMGGGTLSNSSPRKTFFNFRNSLIMLYKNLPGDERDAVINKRKLLDGLAAVFFLIQFKFAHIVQIWKAHKAFDQMKVSIKEKEGAKHLREIDTVLKSSLVFDYFLKGRKVFNELKF